jgi:prepilin peptidase CpaA
VTDLRNRTVPNWLTCAGVLCGLLWYGTTEGLRGAGFSLAGAAVGFASLLVFFFLGGMGGGDVKLMAAFGALVGPRLVFQALIWIALLGAVGAAGSVFWHVWRSRMRRSGKAQGDFIPYAPAIVGGVWFTLWAS